MPQNRSAKVLLGIALGVVLMAAFPMTAFAGINDLPSPVGSSATNPDDEDDTSSWWRRGWGNSLTPEFTLTVPSADPPVLGMIYTVDRDPGTEIDETQPAAYDYAWDPAGTALSHDLDILGIYGSNPALFVAPEPGARLPYEGVWQFHWSFFNSSEMATRTITGSFGIDVTPPAPVTKLVARPYVGYTGPTSGVWFDSRRATVVWEDMEYDDLSGTAAYEVWVNDKRLEFPSGTPRYTYHLGHTFTSATIEDMPPGKNKVAVVTVDRATNTAQPAVTYFHSDTDVPIVNITKPSAGGYVGKSGVFTATATDGAGIQSVRFYIDGVLVYTDSAAPYELAKDMSAYANGTHKVKVIAKDMFGREVYEVRDFILDKTPAKLTSVSDSPDPFYPVLLDGYGDYSNVKFWTNEKVTAYVYYYSSSGSLFASRSGARNAGWGQLRWDGRDSSGKVGLGTFKYRVVVVDQAGNKTYSAYSTSTIRNYQLVRVSDNAVKVIPR
ncbi:MAG: Ig-like domain-containing protein [Coriobacteriia bacterium]